MKRPNRFELFQDAEKSGIAKYQKPSKKERAEADLDLNDRDEKFEEPAKEEVEDIMEFPKDVEPAPEDLETPKNSEYPEAIS